MEPSGVGRLLILVGVISLVAGGIFLLLGKTGITSLPGDLKFGKGNFRFYFPIGTSIVLSIILTLVLNLILRNR
ncbi:MAG: DUF2905 domain-containing protein [Actinomycetota bacterium]